MVVPLSRLLVVVVSLLMALALRLLLLLHLGHHLGHHGLLGFGVGRSASLHLLYLLHVLHVLLPPLGHGLGGHATVGVLGRSGGGICSTSVAVIVVVVVVAASMGRSRNCIGHCGSAGTLGPVLGSLDLNGLVLENQQGLGQNGVHGLLGVERDEPESPRPARVLVNHELSVNDGAVLLKELLVVLFGDIGAHSAHENLTGLVLLFSRDSSLGIDDLSVKVVLLGHDCVHTLGVSEGEKSESTRLAGKVIAHDSAFQHLAKLRKVVGQRLVGGFPVETSNEHLTLVLGRDDNVSQSGISIRPVNKIAVGSGHGCCDCRSHLGGDRGSRRSHRSGGSRGSCGGGCSGNGSGSRS